MSASFGRIALGVVGAVIGTPFGLTAVGFSLGSAIGGFVFAPDGPSSEGPRIGDTDVSASSLGKTIADHYGTTRTASNMIWSGGLNETKTVTENEGGKGGPDPGTQTTYSYSSTFAMAFGRAPAVALIRMWADGKMIYDVTGASAGIQNDKYKFTFMDGGPDQAVHPLIEESIDRRLSGINDVNSGTESPASYRTIEDLIAEADASGNTRSAIYSERLTARKLEADTAGGTPKSYRFTPAYKEFTYILFDDLPLEDFGNRVPNITAEIVWNTGVPVEDVVIETEIPILGEDGIPNSMYGGVDTVSGNLVTVHQGAVTQGGGLVSLWNRSARTQIVTKDNEDTIFYDRNDGFDNLISTALNIQLGYIVATDTKGNHIGWARYKEEILALGSTNLIKINPTTLDYSGMVEKDDVGEGFHIKGNIGPLTTFFTNVIGCAAGDFGTTSLVCIIDDNERLTFWRTDTPVIELVWGAAGASSGSDEYFFTNRTGVIVAGKQTSGNADMYYLEVVGTAYTIHKINIRFDLLGELTTVTVSTLVSGTFVDATDGTPNELLFDPTTEMLFLFLGNLLGNVPSFIAKLDTNATGLAGDPVEQWREPLIQGTGPHITGISLADVSNGFLVYPRHRSIIIVDLLDGSNREMTDVLATSVQHSQLSKHVYNGSDNTLFVWYSNGTTSNGPAMQVELGRIGTSHPADLAEVIRSICTRSGMLADEFDVTSIEGLHDVRGYTVARTSTGRQSLEKLMLAYFVDGIETDWTVKFTDRTTTPIRTITDDELGIVTSPTGGVNWIETRTPEYDLPSEISMVFTDIDRDYQQGSAHVRRVSNPVQVMYSDKIQNIEMPIVFKDYECKDIAQRLMFLTWMSRNQSKTQFSWEHADLDPTDVININLKDGSILTDRIAKATMGANFEIDVETARSGDPVYSSIIAAEVSGGNIPVNTVQIPVYSKLFVFDIPLLNDFDDLGRTAQRFYVGVGADVASWRNAALYDSLDDATFDAFDTAVSDLSWGTITGQGLRPPRTLFTTDTENSITVRLSVDKSDINTITRDQLINTNMNRALIWNEITSTGEIIQFQNVTDNGDGTITIDTMKRGMRGTDTDVSDHTTGEFLIMISEDTVLRQTNPTAALLTTQYYKAVSRGGSLSRATSLSVNFEGKDLKPYAPSRVKRTDDGTDLTVTWNRRSRVNGQWNMVGTGVEPLPLNEDSESYEFYLLPNTATALSAFDPIDLNTYELTKTIGTTEVVITDAELTAAGYALSDSINVAVFQLSAQIGRGFPRTVTLAV